MIVDNSDEDINYEMHLKSTTGEISVYIIQQELAESYDNSCVKLRLQPEPERIKQETVLEEKSTEKIEDKIEEIMEEIIEEKKQEVKPKKRIGRYGYISIYFFYSCNALIALKAASLCF